MALTNILAQLSVGISLHTSLPPPQQLPETSPITYFLPAQRQRFGYITEYDREEPVRDDPPYLRSQRDTNVGPQYGTRRSKWR